MDAEVPELGPGFEPADCPVWGTAHRIPVKRNGVAASENLCHPLLILSAFILLPKNPILIPEAGCGQSPRKSDKIECLFLVQKNKKKCIDFQQLVIL